MSHVKSLQEEAEDEFITMCQDSGFSIRETEHKLRDFRYGYLKATADALHLVREEKDQSLEELFENMGVLMTTFDRQSRVITNK